MPDPAPSPVVVDDALHAVMPADVTGADEDRTACDLSLADVGGINVRFVATLDRARASGVNCLLCLGWLGARDTHPPVIVKGSWFPYSPPSLPGETDDAFTDRLTGAAAARYLREHGADVARLTFQDIRTAQVPPEVTIPYDHSRNRQCSIGYHDECSDPSGDHCECPCHRQPPPGTVIKVDGEDHVVMPPPSPADALISKIMDDVLDELMRARDKFPGQHLPLGFGAAADGWIPGISPYSAADVRDMFRTRTDHASEDGTLTWRHVLTEEGFEAFAEDDPARARVELAQLAAMCVRAILDIDDPQPVAFTGPSGVRWCQVGVDTDGAPVVALDAGAEVPHA